MNEDMFAGQWKQMRGALKSWWGNLTDDDIEKIGGQKDRLIGILQERYGYSRDYAQREVDRRFNEYGDMTGGTTGSGLSGSGTIEDMKSKAYEFGATAASKAREATAGAANGLERARSYFTENDFGTIGADLAGVIRKYPISSALVGAGITYLLARNREYTGGGSEMPGSGAIEDMKSKAYEFGATAATKAREATAGAASELEKAGSYLKKRNIEDIGGDFTGLIRKYPVQSAMVGLGLFYLLSRRRNR